DQLRSVTVTDGHRSWHEPCEYLACGYGLVPNVELAAHLGCAVAAGHVQVDQWQETTRADIYCAGEATGIGGLDKSLVEGTTTGYAATAQRSEARGYFRRRSRACSFALALERAFELRDELK